MLFPIGLSVKAQAPTTLQRSASVATILVGCNTVLFLWEPLRFVLTLLLLCYVVIVNVVVVVVVTSRSLPCLCGLLLLSSTAICGE